MAKKQSDKPTAVFPWFDQGNYPKLPWFDYGNSPEATVNLPSAGEYTLSSPALRSFDGSSGLGWSPPAGRERPAPDGSPPRSKFLTVADVERILAERLGHPVKGVESFLRRYYHKKHPFCREEVRSQKRTEPRIMYRTADVWPVLWAKYSRRKK